MWGLGVVYFCVVDLSSFCFYVYAVVADCDTCGLACAELSVCVFF